MQTHQLPPRLRWPEQGKQPRSPFSFFACLEKMAATHPVISPSRCVGGAGSATTGPGPIAKGASGAPNVRAGSGSPRMSGAPAPGAARACLGSLGPVKFVDELGIHGDVLRSVRFSLKTRNTDTPASSSQRSGAHECDAHGEVGSFADTPQMDYQQPPPRVGPLAQCR